MSITISLPQSFEVEHCCSCGMPFAMTSDFKRKCREDGRSFYCPQGHSQHYKRTEITKLRDRGYLDWLKETRQCVPCFIEDEKYLVRTRGVMQIFYQQPDPAHGPSAGKGLKGPDSGAIPLCRQHHVEQHAIGWPAFEAKYGFSREETAKRLYAQYLRETGKAETN